MANVEPTETTTMEQKDEATGVEPAAGDAPQTNEKATIKNENTTETTDSSEPSPLDAKIIRQIEYYFGDANMERDKFLIAEMKKDDGWVAVKTLLTFNRLKALSEDPDVIIAALKKSTNDLLELKADGTAIRRHPTRPLPSADARQDLQKRILYVKGFPTDLTLDDLIEYFDQHGGESVSLRKNAKREFKGSVFVRFKTDEQAKAFLEPEEMKYKETLLIKRLYKDEYFKLKQEERLGSKQEVIKEQEERKKKKEQEEKEEFESRMTRGALLKVTGVETDSSVEKLKEFFGTFGKVAWVDHVKGDDHAVVRFGTENEAKPAWEKAVLAGTDGKVLLNDKELTASFIDGTEEEAHWKKIFESMKSKYSNRGKNKFGRGGHRGGRGGFKRRNAGNDTDTPKKAKTESS